MITDGFKLRQSRGIPYYSCEAFEKIPGLRHGFSTRHYVSANPSGPATDSRRRLLLALGLDTARLTMLHQVHSNQVHIVDAESSTVDGTEGDALVTQTVGIALAVKTADCFPVLIMDPVRRVIAAVHSGWRGTLKRVLPATVRTMQQVFSSDPADLIAATGPAIRTCCFEVGDEVASLFDEEFPGAGLSTPSPKPEKSYLNLYGALRIQLAAAGVREGNCYDLAACTCCRPDEFFSYRAESSSSGRLLSVISLS